MFRAPAKHAKTPTIAFTVKGTAPPEIARACAQQAVFVTNGDFYATTLAARLGLGESGGWVRLGLAPYIGEAEVTRAITAISQAARVRLAKEPADQATRGTEKGLMKITATHHFGLTVSNLARSLEFYERMFGLVPEFIAHGEGDELSRAVGVPDANLNFAFLRVGNGTVELLEYDNDRQLSHGKRNCDVGAPHLCFDVPDIDAAYAELRCQGSRLLLRATADHRRATRRLRVRLSARPRRAHAGNFPVSNGRHSWITRINPAPPVT